MTEDAGAGRRSRRDNGLVAAAYLPLADLDPRVAEAVLGALREAGVAAYLSPSTGRTGGYLEVSLPDRPSDRVWVDSRARPRAAAILAELNGRGAPAPVDEDEAWRAIVATFSNPPSGTPTWPAAEELDPGRRDAGGGPTGRPGVADAADPAGEGPVTGADFGRPGDGARLVRPAGPASARPPVSPDAVGVGSGDPDDDHYVPPVPPPVPQPHPVTRWAALALAVGLAVLVIPAILGSPVGSHLAVLAVLAVVGGAGTLVARMRDAPPTDSGPDDGAVV